MTTVTIIFILFCFTLTLCSIAAAFYLYGINQMQKKMVVESRRFNKRLAKESFIWQNLYVRKTGGGLLNRKPKPESNEPAALRQRVVSPTQAILEAKNGLPPTKARIVPPSIARDFLGKKD